MLVKIQYALKCSLYKKINFYNFGLNRLIINTYILSQPALSPFPSPNSPSPSPSVGLYTKFGNFVKRVLITFRSILFYGHPLFTMIEFVSGQSRGENVASFWMEGERHREREREREREDGGGWPPVVKQSQCEGLFFLRLKF